ncbi:hypothetical protein MHYP_G00118440 [Metynnis hypsauchen]
MQLGHTCLSCLEVEAHMQEGRELPQGRQFSLSVLKWKAMENNVQDSLALGFIWPFTSPAGAAFFFVGKKDGGLQGLKKITVKDQYPLPHRTSAFKVLQQTSVFAKLDMCSAYNLIWVRQGDGLYHSIRAL